MKRTSTNQTKGWKNHAKRRQDISRLRGATTKEFYSRKERQIYWPFLIYGDFIHKRDTCGIIYVECRVAYLS